MWKVKFLALVFLLLVFVLEVDSRGRIGRQRRIRVSPPCRPRACKVSSWSEWSPCTHQCGKSGIQTRARKKIVFESCGGSCPFFLKGKRPCNRFKCQNSRTPTGKDCSCLPRYNGMCCEIGKYNWKQITRTSKIKLKFKVLCLQNRWRIRLAYIFVMTNLPKRSQSRHFELFWPRTTLNRRKLKNKTFLR